jgi:hypothetical protein
MQDPVEDELSLGFEWKKVGKITACIPRCILSGKGTAVMCGDLAGLVD